LLIRLKMVGEAAAYTSTTNYMRFRDSPNC